MEGVTAALLVAVVVVLALAAGGTLKRRLLDERTSVRDYHQTLETLRHLSDQRRVTAAVPSHSVAANDAALPAVPDARYETNGHRGHQVPSQSSRSPLVAGVAPGRPPRPAAYAPRWWPSPVSMRVKAPLEHGEPAPSVEPTPDEVVAPAPVQELPAALVAEEAPSPPPSSSTNASTAADAVRQLIATRHRYGTGPSRVSTPSSTRPDRRPVLATVAAAVVIGAVTAVAVVEAPSHSSSSHHSATTATSTVARHTVLGPARASSKSAPSKTATAPSHTGAPSGLDPVTASSASATYQVPSAPYTVVVSDSSGPCWMEATDSANGQVLWQGTLQPGTSQSIPAGGGLVLRLGNSPAVTLTEGGQAVRLPAGAADVIDLTFVVA